MTTYRQALATPFVPTIFELTPVADEASSLITPDWGLPVKVQPLVEFFEAEARRRRSARPRAVAERWVRMLGA